MNVSNTLLRSAVEKAKPILDRFGILGSPVRDLLDARRSLTVDRPLHQVRDFLGDQSHAAELFLTGDAARVQDSATPGVVQWQLGATGRASAHLGRGPDETTELMMEVHLHSPIGR